MGPASAVSVSADQRMAGVSADVNGGSDEASCSTSDAAPVQRARYTGIQLAEGDKGDKKDWHHADSIKREKAYSKQLKENSKFTEVALLGERSNYSSCSFHLTTLIPATYPILRPAALVAY